MTQVIVNGNTYSDDGSTSKDMNDGGSADWFFPMVSDVMHDVAQAVHDSALNNQASLSNALVAINAPGASGTSTTSLAVGLGNKSFTMQLNKNFIPGMWVTISRNSDPGNYWMNGPITAYDPATGAMTVNSKRSQGTATTTGWTISLSAPGAYDTGGVRFTNAPAGFVNVTSSDFRYQVATPASGGHGYIISGASTNIPGPASFTFRNRASGYGFDMAVVDSSGTAHGYVPPDKEVTVNGRDGGTWEASGTRAYGSDVLAKVTFSTTVGGTAGIFTKALTIDADRTLLLVHGASLHAVIYSASAAAFGTPLLVRATMSAAGDDTSVVAVSLADGTDNVLIASCPASTTGLQVVVLQISGTSMILGTVFSTTLASAAVRLIDLIPVGTLATAFALATMVTTTTINSFAINIASSTTVTISAAPIATTTSGSWAALLTVPGTDIYMVMSATATVLGAKPITITPSTTTQVAGTSGTTTISSLTGLALRYESFWGAWAVMFINATAKVSKLTVAGTVATISAQTAVQSAVTTINALACGTDGFDFAGGPLLTALSGTDSSGRFLTESFQLDFSGAAPGVLQTYSVYMGAAHTPVILRSQRWQLASASEAVMWAPGSAGATADDWRMPGLVTYSQVVAVTDPLYPKVTKARSTLRSATRAMSVLDGTKPSLLYNCSGGHADATSAPVRLINTPLNSVNLTGEQDYIWAATGPAPSLSLTIQKLRLI